MTVFSDYRDLISSESRKLKDSEKRLARLVFHDTLPLYKVRLVNRVGLEGRPFAFVTTEVECDANNLAIGVAANYVSPVAAATYRMLNTCSLESSHYYLYVGTKYANDMTATKTARELLIHELVHVWQGEYGVIPVMYMLQSVCEQAMGGDTAYDYEVDDDSKWDDFGIEQQANIVDEWYSDGMKEDDERFRFIENVIRSKEYRDLRW